ncbi:MAG: hypothetical protein CO170_02895 [candidate division SR1 bacterium CG_4_9_14_3_um_filter_40_9]|nr:MAG: hypothetical protein CO170_02895 [candidate division SR1 bacterium CG_4_9_14_3_um_filter_40_9]
MSKLKGSLWSDSAYLEHIFKHIFLLHAIESEVEDGFPIVVQIREKEVLSSRGGQALLSGILNFDAKEVVG